MANAAPVAGFKVPSSYDQNRPKFDGSTPNSLKLFIRNTETICKNGGITTDQARKEKLLEYLDHMDINEQWQRLPGFDKAKKYDEWKEEILELYPEIEDMTFGSMEKLQEICRQNQYIKQTELGKLRRFSLAFRNEAEKLMDGTAAVVNKHLVELILAVLEPSFAQEVERAVGRKAIDDLARQGATPAQLAAKKSRRGDRMPYATVLEIADYIADTWSGGSVGNYLLGGKTRSATQAGVIPVDYGNMVKQEVQEKLDTFASELAQLKDMTVVQGKHMTENFKKWDQSLENSFKLMNQSLRGPPPHQTEITQAGPSRREGNSGQSGEGPCFFCNGPHIVRFCTAKDEYITIGWIKVEDRLIKMGDGSWIPRYPESISRKAKVDEYWAKKGVSKEMAMAKKSSLMATFYPVHEGTPWDFYETERIGDLYDTREDEIRSAKIQQFEARARVAPYPVAQMIQAPMASYFSGTQLPQQQGGVQPPPQGPIPNQVSNDRNVVPVVAPAGSMVDMNQLIQLFNAMGRTDQSAMEQFVTTRGGSKSDPPANQNF